MPSNASAISTPASAIVTTAETLAVNIPAQPLTPPPGAPQAVIVRGALKITTGASTTSLAVRLRAGQNNTTTAQVGNTNTVACGAGATFTVPFHFIDTAGPANLALSGYSITVVQTAASANGTIVEVTYEVDYSYH